MKKLEKRFRKQSNTIQAYICESCKSHCCPCSYCAATWSSQQAADVARTYHLAHDVLFASY